MPNSKVVLDFIYIVVKAFQRSVVADKLIGLYFFFLTSLIGLSLDCLRH